LPPYDNGMTPDVTIVGGGIIGLTCAAVLARRGAKVALYDSGDFGKQASWAGAGIIPPGNPRRAATPFDWLRAYGAAHFAEFSAELGAATGIDNGYRPCGGVEQLGPNDDGVRSIWAAEGIRFEPFHPTHEPNLAIDDVDAVFLPALAQVRNPWHIRALVEYCRGMGVELQPHVAVVGNSVDADRVRTIRMHDGTMSPVNELLLCPGAWAGKLLAHFACDFPVFPVRGQIALLQGERGVLSRVVLVGKRYLVPRGDGLVLVGSSEEPEAGFQTGTTPEVVLGLVSFARSLVPALNEAAVVKAWSGLRPGSGDGLPYIGRVPGWANVSVAAGHFRAGVQQSLGTAEVVARMLLDSVTPDGLFAVGRDPQCEFSAAFRS
jgi:glycine oxidase